MLHLKFFDNLDIEDKDIEKDVEMLFNSIRVTGTKEEREVLKLLEQVEYLDENFVLDKFGMKLWIDSISTGSKTALCILNNTDKWVSSIECGANAQSIIISVCKNGKVIMDDKEVTFRTSGLNTDIEVELDGKIFYSTHDLNDYMQNERLLEYV